VTIVRRSLEGKRVMVVLPSFGLGGAERQGFLLARHLAVEQQAAVRLVALNVTGPVADWCGDLGIPTQLFPMTHRYRSRRGQLVDILRFTGLLRRQRVDVLLPYCMFQNILCSLTWRAGGARVCIWNQRDEGRSRLEPWIERMAIRQMRCFVSNSTHGAEFLVGTLGVTRDRVQVVWNGVELPLPQSERAEWRARLNLPSDAFVACMVANLHGHKDHAVLIEAWPEVAR